MINQSITNRYGDGTIESIAVESIDSLPLQSSNFSLSSILTRFDSYSMNDEMVDNNIRIWIRLQVKDIKISICKDRSVFYEYFTTL